MSLLDHIRAQPDVLARRVYTQGMGMVEVRMEVANPQRMELRTAVTLLVDTGAAYSIIPRPTLEQIGIAPMEREEFEVADGLRIQRDIGEATFFWDSKRGTSKVIFGEDSDAAVLGVVALESLALEVDPLKKQLRRTKLILY